MIMDKRPFVFDVLDTKIDILTKGDKHIPTLCMR